MVHKLFWLALAGALGTLARYGLTWLTHSITGTAFPWGTLVVNVVGCFLIGMLWTLFEQRWALAGETRIIVLVGFLGAFTTFSSYMLETTHLLRDAEWHWAAANLVAQNVLGLIALVSGGALGRVV